MSSDSEFRRLEQEQPPEWAKEAADTLLEQVVSVFDNPTHHIMACARQHEGDYCDCSTENIVKDISKLREPLARIIADACAERLSLVSYLMDMLERLKAQHADEIAAAEEAAWNEAVELAKPYGYLERITDRGKGALARHDAKLKKELREEWEEELIKAGSKSWTDGRDRKLQKDAPCK